MGNWNGPQEWTTKPHRFGTDVLLLVDFGSGEFEVEGTAYLVDGGDVVFSDGKMWCTRYVKAWRENPAAK